MALNKKIKIKNFSKIKQPPFHCLGPRIRCKSIIGCGKERKGKGRERKKRKEKKEKEKLFLILENKPICNNCKLLFIIEKNVKSKKLK